MNTKENARKATRHYYMVGGKRFETQKDVCKYFRFGSSRFKTSVKLGLIEKVVY